MQILATTLAALALSSQAMALDEIKTPEDMASCLTRYVQNNIVAPEQIESWEHAPAYEFFGKYFGASWHTTPLFHYGMIDMMAGPSEPVYCDYESLPSGGPDRAKPGFCRPNIVNGEVIFRYSTFNGSLRVEKPVKVAAVIDSRILCLAQPNP
jgi:hypothetical protein